MVGRNYPRTCLIGIGAVALLVIPLTGCGGGGPSSSSTPVPGGGARAAELRTVLVFDEAKRPSSSTTLHADLEEGSLPSRPVVGTVLTDEDCAPDRQGISHCRNEVSVAGSGVVVLRHPHDMRQVPCLAPGERVLLRRAA